MYGFTNWIYSGWKLFEFFVKKITKMSYLKGVPMSRKITIIGSYHSALINSFSNLYHLPAYPDF